MRRRRRYVRSETVRGMYLDGERHGLWLELVDGQLRVTWWVRGELGSTP